MCQTKVPDNVRFCVACTAARAPKPSDGSKEHSVTDRIRYAFLYSSARWTSIAQRVLRKQPFCKRCGLNISELVDHIVPVSVVIVQAQESGRWPLHKWAGFYLESNLQALCRACHFVKTAEDKAHVGAWADAIAIEEAAPKRVFSF